MSTAPELLQRLLSSEVKGDLLTLFHKNPGLIDTVEGIARRIGRTANTINGDLRDLIEVGVLRTKRFGQSEAIALDHSRDAAVQQVVAEYLATLKAGKRT